MVVKIYVFTARDQYYQIKIEFSVSVIPSMSANYRHADFVHKYTLKSRGCLLSFLYPLLVE